MGYQTDFTGEWNISPKLTDEDREILVKFNETRRMTRDVDPKYGTDGEWYVDGLGLFGQDIDETVVSTSPPSTQPGPWCQWRPNDDGTAFLWDDGEKFYNYVEWIVYLVDNFFKPKGYTLNGTVSWIGEEPHDLGRIRILGNVVEVGTVSSINFSYTIKNGDNDE